MNHRVPPNDISAEQSVLGAMMSSPDACDKVLDILTAEDFYRDSHREVFDAITRIRTTGVDPDPVAVCASIPADVSERIGGTDYIYTLVEFVPAISNAVHYAHIVQSTARRRKLITVGLEISDLAYEELDSDKVLDSSWTKLSALTNKSDTTGPELLKDLVPNAEARIYDASKGKRSCGRKTHITGLNSLIGGLEDGSYVVLAARPSQGKSAMAMNIAAHVAVNAPVLFFSVEMSKGELVDRMLANTSGVGLSKIRTGDITEDETSRLFASTPSLAKLDMAIDDSVSTMAEIQRRVSRIATRQKLGLIVIDYLQLLTQGSGRPESRQLEVSMMSRGVKLMAKEYKVPVLALSQLNRPDSRFQSEDAKQPRPTLQSLRESGAIEQDADVVMFLYKEYEASNDVDLLVMKNRNGPTGKVRLRFTPHTVTFLERND